MKKAIFTILLVWAYSIGSFGQDQVLKLVILPDTQSYLESCPEIMESQFTWLANNHDQVDHVLHVGDITQGNTPAEWALSAHYFDLINDKIPYAIALGNHDFGSGPHKFADNRDSHLANKYFPLEKLQLYTTIQGTFEEGKIDNAFYTFEKAGQSWLILSLEFGPTEEMLDWANKVVEDHPNHRVILLTHAYMYVGNQRLSKGDDWSPHAYGIGKSDSLPAPHDGEEIWQKLVKKHPNFLMTFSGHILHEGLGRLVSKGDHGNDVYQFLANYQRGVKGYGKGCNGFLRLVDIDLEKMTIQVRTYSPWLDQWLEDEQNQFEYAIE